MGENKAKPVYTLKNAGKSPLYHGRRQNEVVKKCKNGQIIQF